jgi:hypothetical protein
MWWSSAPPASPNPIRVVPANISVITRDDIRNTPGRRPARRPAQSNAGVDVRALYGSLGIDSTSTSAASAKPPAAIR